MLIYGLAIFNGAFLLFQVQPLIAKYILPWFGGSPSVWTTCMLFFQLFLCQKFQLRIREKRRLGVRDLETLKTVGAGGGNRTLMGPGPAGF